MFIKAADIHAPSRHLHVQRRSGRDMRRLVSATLAEAAGDGAERLFVYLILHL